MVLFLRGVSAPAWAAVPQGCVLQHGVLHGRSSSQRSPIRHGIPLCPQPCPLPRFSLVFFKTCLLLYLLMRLPTPSPQRLLRCVPLLPRPPLGGASGAAPCAPLIGRSAGTAGGCPPCQNRPGPARDGVWRPPTQHPAAPVTRTPLFMPNTATEPR